MAVFYEHEVIDGLHIDEAVVGKKYFCADTIVALKQRVENNDAGTIHELTSIGRVSDYCFYAGCAWALLYPYEEPPKQIEDLQIKEYSNLCEQRKIIHRNLIEAFSEQLGILDKEDDELFSLKAIKAVISNILEIEE